MNMSEDQTISPTGLLHAAPFATKVCVNPRAEKLNNKLHKLCEFHRKKANLNQQRLQQRRRMDKRGCRERGMVNSPSAPHHFDEFGSPLEFPNCEFSPEELKMLEIMLFDSDEGLKLALEFDHAYE